MIWLTDEEITSAAREYAKNRITDSGRDERTFEAGAKFYRDHSPKWIDIKSRLPEVNTKVIVFVNDIVLFGTLWKGNRWNVWNCDTFVIDKPTHWQPLPDSPNPTTQQNVKHY